jgi:histidine triad (HIT) family protein
MADCIFCKIVSKEIPSRVVHEDEEILAFEDVNPVAPVHILIVPKKHVATVNDLTGEHANLVGSMVLRAQAIAREREVSREGYRIVMNCMHGAGQTVFHLHLHLLGGRPFGWPPG